MRGRVSGVVEGMDEKGKVKGMVVVVIGFLIGNMVHFNR